MSSKTWENINKNLYTQDNYTRFEEIYSFIVKEVGLGKKVCDLGCGDGSLGERLMKNNNLVFGADAVQPQVDIAKSKGLEASVADLNSDSLSFESNNFDVVIATEVIEHLLSPDNLLDEAHRILKNDGKFIITTPNLASLGRRIFLLFGKNPVIEVSPNEKRAVGHLRYFVKESLYGILKDHKFIPYKFCSDVVNFDARGRLRSHILARIIPGFGRSLICVCRKDK